jgi:SAM-dependent methyltransferase
VALGSRRSDGDPRYLSAVQYARSDHLLARIRLHERYSVNPASWRRWTFEQLSIPETASVLELGCGTGALWVENADRIPPGWHLTLTDFSGGMLHSARAALDGVLNIDEFRVVDAQAIPYEGGTFDCVIANHMLYHVPDRLLALSEIRRVLGDGGRLYATANGLGHMRKFKALMRRHLGVPLVDDTPERFGLENGAAQLTSVFSNVELKRYHDRLEVTSVEDAMAYVASLIPGEAANDAALSQIEREIQTSIEADGALQVDKNQGLFICSA